jgi:hypothetical protein
MPHAYPKEVIDMTMKYMPLVLVKEYVVDSSIPKSWTYTRGRTIA